MTAYVTKIQYYRVEEVPMVKNLCPYQLGREYWFRRMGCNIGKIFGVKMPICSGPKGGKAEELARNSFHLVEGRGSALVVKQFSLTETSYVVVRFLQKYNRVENLEKPGWVLHHHTVSNRSKNGAEVRLHRTISSFFAL
ncbi:62bc5f1e-fd12-4cc5-8561-06c4783eca05-CDS [Sclerotinia trifoliorum]|uniref:62bc5f1e-fd12-4cc5-8561-06c4783eca05-CDS n=1 Tax=Sclerotinia trifoliorum TaxID=28548 RepID=A0A8H2W332_9HELO|nr:62bc5f1e-fd12-4cc5-8561-06c4783eca05-CDS [Sclerotinia trifoliorum]